MCRGARRCTFASPLKATPVTCVPLAAHRKSLKRMQPPFARQRAFVARARKLEAAQSAVVACSDELPTPGVMHVWCQITAPRFVWPPSRLSCFRGACRYLSVLASLFYSLPLLAPDSRAFAFLPPSRLSDWSEGVKSVLSSLVL